MSRDIAPDFALTKAARSSRGSSPRTAMPSRPAPFGRICVKVINHVGDEVQKWFWC